MLLAVPWFAACREMAADSAGHDGERNRVIAVGELADLTLLDDDLAASGARRVQLVDRLATTEAAGSGNGSPLVERARACGATVVVLTRTAQQDETVVAQAAELHHQGLRVRTLSRFYEDWLGKFPMGELERISLLFDISEVHNGPYSRVKRLIDVALAICGLPVLFLAVPVVALANRFGNRGPLLFRQERVGKNGRRFEMLKFRTMVPGSSDGSWTADDDPRVTRMGRVLRTTHVDELPQVLNILRGELSFVGPRPEQPRYVDELVGKIPFYELRHLVRPGLTGWAQINYGYAGNEHDALEKLQYDFFYLRHQRLRFDLRVVARTVRTVFQRHGR
jgi:lipopolysaccharide/colanic/teichoic acid biosynthesis glycosyltransferase